MHISTFSFPTHGVSVPASQRRLHYQLHFRFVAFVNRLANMTPMYRLFVFFPLSYVLFFVRQISRRANWFFEEIMGFKFSGGKCLCNKPPQQISVLSMDFNATPVCICVPFFFFFFGFVLYFGCQAGFTATPFGRKVCCLDTPPFLYSLFFFVLTSTINQLSFCYLEGVFTYPLNLTVAPPQLLPK